MSNPGASLDIVANAELKALTYMSMDDVGEATVTAIEQHVVEKYELEDVINRANNTVGAYAITFACHGFATVQMQPSKYNSRVVRYFAPAQRDETIPEIGATLGWAKEYGMPLRWLLSTTASKSSRAPSNSIGLLRASLHGTAIIDMAGDGYSSGDPNNSRLKTLMERGIVREDDSLGRFTVNDPTYTGRRIPFERLKFETQHLYTSLQAAKELFPDRDWTRNELFDFASTLLPQNLRTDEQLLKRLHRQIGMAISVHTPRAYAGVINKVDISRTHIKVADEHQEAVADLIERVDELASSLRSRASFKDEAYDIYTDITTAKDLILNDIGDSPKRNIDLVSQSG